MHGPKYTGGAIVLSFLANIVSTQANLANFDPFTTPKGAGCVDPQGFRDCFQQNLESFVDCGQNFCKSSLKSKLQSETECLAGCQTIRLQSSLVCWVKSCWNQVFSCEYQLTAIQYLGETNVRTTINGGVPFYPAPDNGGGACSCNLGYIETNQTIAGANSFQCALGQESPEKGAECLCCAASLGFSGLSICPNSDLSFTDSSQANQQEAAAKLGEISSDKCAILENNASACGALYKLPLPNVPVVNPFNLPALGKEEVTNLPGNAFTDGGGVVVTVSLEDANFVKTVTLAPWNGAATNAAAATAAGDSSGKSVTKGAGSKATGVSTGGGSQSSTPSSAKMVVAPGVFWIGGLCTMLGWNFW